MCHHETKNSICHMKRLFLSLALMVLTLWVAAKSYNVQNLPALNNTTRVANPDNILSPATVDSINSMLLTFDRHKVQCLIAVVERIDNDDPYDFAIGLGRRFGVGGKSSQGVVIVLATLDRSYQIVTGSGMEKFLPDAICKRIEMKALVPYLKEGKWDNGMTATVKMMCQYLEKDPEVMEQTRSDENEEFDETFFMIAGIIIILIFLCAIALAFYSEYKSRCCPKCGKHQFRVTHREKTVDRKGNTHVFTTRVCRLCGHTSTKETIIKKEQDQGGGGVFFIGGGGGHGSIGGGGGGFSSFGGGTFSGGGAGGRF